MNGIFQLAVSLRDMRSHSRVTRAVTLALSCFCILSHGFPNKGETTHILGYIRGFLIVIKRYLVKT